MLQGRKMLPRKRVLFVDDEPSIRLTLPPILEEHGFEVRSAGSVAEALVEINSAQFDALLSDLNIGDEGDGFLVVSAMRHVQPDCINVILTGYPAFDTALEAIRHQVDDYLLKPADVDALVKTLREKFESGSGRNFERKRLAALMRENSAAIVARVLEAMKQARQPATNSDDKATLGKMREILNSISAELEKGNDQITPQNLIPAAEHGILRRKQGQLASAIVADFQLLETHIYEVIEKNLPNLGEGRLISDLKRLQRTLTSLMKSAITAHEEPRERKMRT
jgi:ActR/RegA family two-component response regulator